MIFENGENIFKKLLNDSNKINKDEDDSINISRELQYRLGSWYANNNHRQLEKSKKYSGLDEPLGGPINLQDNGIRNKPGKPGEIFLKPPDEYPFTECRKPDEKNHQQKPLPVKNQNKHDDLNHNVHKENFTMINRKENLDDDGRKNLIYVGFISIGIIVFILFILLLLYLIKHKLS